jgi:hypothetical protein
LIALDKEWGEAGGDAAKLDKLIGGSALAIGPKGEAQDKQQLIASNKAASTDVTTATYTADEYKFDMPSSDVVVMTHRGTTKGMQNGKEVTESHRSLRISEAEWPVAGSGQRAIAYRTIERGTAGSDPNISSINAAFMGNWLSRVQTQRLRKRLL